MPWPGEHDEQQTTIGKKLILKTTEMALACGVLSTPAGAESLCWTAELSELAGRYEHICTVISTSFIFAVA